LYTRRTVANVYEQSFGGFLNRVYRCSNSEAVIDMHLTGRGPNP